MTSAQLRETNTIQEHFSSLAELDQSQTVTQQSGQQARTVITHVIVGKLIETYFLLIGIENIKVFILISDIYCLNEARKLFLFSLSR